MANIKIDNIVSSIDSILNQNIVSCSNEVKNNYTSSALYQICLNSNNFELQSLSNEIFNELNSLNNQLNNFNSLFKNYINDYSTVNKYLTDGSRSDITSVPTLNLLNSSLSLKNDDLNDINIINLNLMVEYEKVFTKKDEEDNE